VRAWGGADDSTEVRSHRGDGHRLSTADAAYGGLLEDAPSLTCGEHLSSRQEPLTQRKGATARTLLCCEMPVFEECQSGSSRIGKSCGLRMFLGRQGTAEPPRQVDEFLRPAILHLVDGRKVGIDTGEYTVRRSSQRQQRCPSGEKAPGALESQQKRALVIAPARLIVRTSSGGKNRSSQARRVELWSPAALRRERGT